MSKRLNLRRARRLLRPNPSMPDTSETDADAIARLDRLTQAGRSLWFSLLFYLTFAMITALGVADVDFFIGGSATQLPLIGVAIPTPSFFTFAPILGAALYIYLHLLIRKATEAAAHAPARVKRTAENPDGIPIERAITPWLVIDLALRFRNDRAIDKRPLDRLAMFSTILMVWLAGPYVLGVLWQNTFTLHNFWVTSLAGACFFLATLVGVESWAKLETDTAPPHAVVNTTCTQRYRRAPALFALVLLVGLIGTKGLYIPIDQETLPDMLKGRPFAARPDLREAQLSSLPPDQRDPTVARSKYRAEWCQRVGLQPNICGNLPSSQISAPVYQANKRQKWCQTKPGLHGDACETYFAQRDQEFEKEWDGHRTALIASLEKPLMRDRDLRNTDFTLASLTGVDFSNAQMQGAVLIGAQMEGAVLSGAQMQGAVLWGAQMEGAVLSGAQMQGAVLWGAQMEGAVLSGAQMQGASLSGAQMQGASLRNAQLEGAVLSGAQMQGADLSGAHLKSANWAGLRIDSAPAQFADLRGGLELTQSRLSSLIGNAATLLPDDPDLYVCACWVTEPPSWQTLLDAMARIEIFTLGNPDQFLCPAGQRPQKTGTPWPVDQPPPWGDFETWSDEAKTWAAAQLTRGDCP